MAIIKIDSPEVTIPLSEAIGDNSFKNKFDVFNKIFPSLTKEQLPTVQSISIAALAYRENQGLFQPFSWSSRRQNKFSEAEMDNLLEAVQVFVNRTNINFTDLFGHVIHREWGLFPGANGELWQKSKTNGVFSAPLSFEEKKDFKLNFRIAVVNPDNPYEVWGLGEELPYQKNEGGEKF